MDARGSEAVDSPAQSHVVENVRRSWRLGAQSKNVGVIKQPLLHCDTE